MPYRRRGTKVEVQRGSAWHTLKNHTSVAKAIRHLKALKINVGSHGQSKRKK